MSDRNPNSLGPEFRSSLEGDDTGRKTFGHVYSNSVKAHPGAFDVLLDFGFELGDASEPRETVARVAMSWEHAQALTRVLAGLVERYEQELGALPDIERARIPGDERRPPQ